jgi:hypothetical protein
VRDLPLALQAGMYALCLLTLTSRAEDARPCQRGEAGAAEHLLMKRVEHERLYDGQHKASCLSYASLCTADRVLTSIHEKHDETCGGDPRTAPAIDHFAIDKKTRAIEWMEITSGDMLPFEFICMKTACAKSTAPPRRPPRRD